MGLISLLEDQIRRHKKKLILAGCILAPFCVSEQTLAQNQESRQKQGSVLFDGLRNPSKPENYRYDLSKDYFVTFTEIKDDSQRTSVYEISICVNPSAPQLLNHIRQAGVVMSGGNALDDKVKMFYNDSKSGSWWAISKKGTDHALLMKAYDKYKAWVPQVEQVENGLVKLEEFFNWLDEKRGVKVYPRVVKDGERFLIPVDSIMEDLNISGFGSTYIDGVRFVIPAAGNNRTGTPKNNFFIKFRIGQYSAVPTASTEFGIEILENRTKPGVYSQNRGQLLATKTNIGNDSENYDWMKGFGKLKSDIDQARAEFDTALTMFEIETGRYPTTDEGFKSIFVDPRNIPGWRGPYFRDVILDPWGNPFFIEGDGKECIIYSRGPDGNRKTKDDILVLEKRHEKDVVKEVKGTVTTESGINPGKDLALILNENVKIELVWIPPGEFVMGTNSGRPEEGPAHKVKITKGFWMGKYEVTEVQYESVLGSYPYQVNVGEPAEQISWKYAKKFCKKLTEMCSSLRISSSLPTEAEWEYACRAGTTTRYYTGDSDSDCNDAGWNMFNIESGPGSQTRGNAMSVGRKKPNSFGLFDMHGNVIEWCEDYYDEGYYKNSPLVDPKGPSEGSKRVLRGGVWLNSSEYCTSTFRGRAREGEIDERTGFRIVIKQE